MSAIDRAGEPAGEGHSGVMVSIERDNSQPYASHVHTTPLADVAVAEAFLPRTSENVTDVFLDCLRPLVGEVDSDARTGWQDGGILSSAWYNIHDKCSQCVLTSLDYVPVTRADGWGRRSPDRRAVRVRWQARVFGIVFAHVMAHARLRPPVPLPDH
ncbi:MAG: hypothetical protein KGY81_02160 [Phycisphaerae bacterium]|jgi:hypothetical protein|nr:hypothetical protein [Phycisphaerae bacterium]